MRINVIWKISSPLLRGKSLAQISWRRRRKKNLWDRKTGSRNGVEIKSSRIVCNHDDGDRSSSKCCASGMRELIKKNVRFVCVCDINIKCSGTFVVCSYFLFQGWKLRNKTKLCYYNNFVKQDNEFIFRKVDKTFLLQVLMFFVLLWYLQ